MAKYYFQDLEAFSTKMDDMITLLTAISNKLSVSGTGVADYAKSTADTLNAVKVNSEQLYVIALPPP